MVPLLPVWLLWLLCAALAVAIAYPHRAKIVPGFNTKDLYTWPFLGSLIHVTRNFDRFHGRVLAPGGERRSHNAINDIGAEVGDGLSWSSGILGNPAFVYIGADPFLIEHFLKISFDKYEKGAWFRDTMRVFLGDGIFNSDGGTWQKQRKVASHMFTARNLKEDMSAIFLKNTSLILARIARHAGAASASPISTAAPVPASSGSDSATARPFDIQSLYFAYTLDSFSEIAFGQPAGCLSDGAIHPFALAFDQVQALTTARFFGPSWKAKRLLNIGSERQIKKNIRIMRAWGLEVIQRTRVEREEAKKRGETSNADASASGIDGRKPASLIDRFIDYAEANNQPLPSDDELLDVVLNFIIAGRDTTACLLSWATYELTQHPDLQERLSAEVRDFPLAHAQSSNSASSSSLSHSLPLLHAFICETLRLHPPVPQDTKECIESDVWPAHTLANGKNVPEHRIPAGTMIAWSPYLMGRSESLWGPNASKFDLAKWFTPEGKPIKEPSQYAFPVFNAGPRLCLGKSVALLESSMLLSALLQQFSFSRPAELKDTPVTYALTVTLPIKGGLQVLAQRRGEFDGMARAAV